MKTSKLSFTSRELLLPEDSWRELLRKSILSAPLKKWLVEWSQVVERANSPMDSDERKLLRYGHYLGWNRVRIALGKDRIGLGCSRKLRGSQTEKRRMVLAWMGNFNRRPTVMEWEIDWDTSAKTGRKWIDTLWGD